MEWPERLGFWLNVNKRLDFVEPAGGYYPALLVI